MKHEEDLTIILPTFNERANDSFWSLLDSIINQTNCKIIIVDDGYDNLNNTLNVFKSSRNKAKENITYLRGAKGESESIELALRNVTTKFTAIMDSDGSHPISFIKHVLIDLQEDMILVGSRYTTLGYTNATFLNRWISKISNKFANIFLGGTKQISSDLTGRLLAAETELFLIYDIWYGHGDVAIALLYNLRQMGIPIKDVPIYYSKRVHGQGSTDNIKGIIKYLLHYFIRLIYIKCENHLPFTPRLIARSKHDWSTENYKITYKNIFVSIASYPLWFLFRTLFRLPGTSFIPINFSSSGFGYFIRNAYYSTKFKHCGKDVLIDRGCDFIRPKRLIVSDNVIIDKNVTIISPPNNFHTDLFIDKEVTIHSDVYINGKLGFRIGAYSCIGHKATLFSASNRPGGSYSYATRPHMQNIKGGFLWIGDNCFIGTSSLVINSTLENNTILGAHSFLQDDKLIKGKLKSNDS